MAPSTSTRTLYRLRGVVSTMDAMFDALDIEHLTEIGASIHIADTWMGTPAFLITAGLELGEAEWCAEFARTTGVRVSEEVRRTAALLLIAVDEDVYAIGRDQGYRLIPRHHKDQRFGLSFAIRQIDPLHIRGLVSNTLGRARTDIAIVPGGASAPSLGIRDHARIVRRLGGYLDGIELTRARNGRGQVFAADGGSGLRLPLGIEPGDLISDIREIARACRDRSPQPDLEFVEQIMPVQEADTLSALDLALDEALGLPAHGLVTDTVPMDHLHDFEVASACQMKINSSEAYHSDGFELDYVLGRARVQRAGRRLESLRQGTVTLCRHRGTRARAYDVLATTNVLRWVEAEISLGSRRFCLMDGEWYEFGAVYMDAVRAVVAPLFVGVTGLNPPSWDLSKDEGAYNRHAALKRDGWVCLDRKNVKNPFNATNQVEICDLLTPDNTLIFVKRAHGSGPLSHLFNQARVAVELLQESAEVRAQFALRVFEASEGNRTLPENFTPKHLAFAILLKNGTELTPESLFPFSLITLAQTVKTLTAKGVTVEVVGIQATESSADEALDLAATA